MVILYIYIYTSYMKNILQHFAMQSPTQWFQQKIDHLPPKHGELDQQERIQFHHIRVAPTHQGK